MIRQDSPLLTDLYELTMLQAYLAEGMLDTAVFELFVRKLPPGRNFMVAAGLEQALVAEKADETPSADIPATGTPDTGTPVPEQEEVADEHVAL